MKNSLWDLAQTCEDPSSSQTRNVHDLCEIPRESCHKILLEAGKCNENPTNLPEHTLGDPTVCGGWVSNAIVCARRHHASYELTNTSMFGYKQQGHHQTFFKAFSVGSFLKAFWISLHLLIKDLWFWPEVRHSSPFVNINKLKLASSVWHPWATFRSMILKNMISGVMFVLW